MTTKNKTSIVSKQNCFSKSNLKQHRLIITAGDIIFWKNNSDTLFLLGENHSLVFKQRLIILVLVTITAKFEIK